MAYGNQKIEQEEVMMNRIRKATGKIPKRKVEKVNLQNPLYKATK